MALAGSWQEDRPCSGPCRAPELADVTLGAWHWPAVGKETDLALARAAHRNGYDAAMNKKDKTYALHCMRTCDQSLQQRSHLAVSQWDSETAQPVLLAHDQPRRVRSPKGPSRQNRITPQS